jgi:acyl-CoA synthetase (AMP-forming)/AMP-acid ligase II
MFTASRSYRLTRPVLTSIRSPYFLRLITYSVVEGAPEPSLNNSTLPEYFSTEVLSRRPGHPALICRQERPRAHGGPLSKNMGVERHLAWDFDEFDNHIRALARGLVGLGVNKGDRVGVIMGNNRYAFLTAIVATGICSPSSFSKCVCDAAMGMCKYRSNIGYHKSCISCSRAGGLS